MHSTMCIMSKGTLKKIKEQMETSVGYGSLDKMDAKDVEMRLKELELTIRQLQANLSTARLELSRLMGLNQNVQYTLYRPKIEPIIKALPHPSEMDIDKLEEFALLHRPELFESDIQVMIQKDDVKREVMSLFPGVSLFAGTHYDSNRLLHANNWNTVGAGIGWELLDLPSRIAMYQGSKKAVEMAEAQRLMLTAGIITQVHIGLLDYSIKVDRFRLLEETFELASDLRDMAEKKNAVGKLTRLAVTQRHLEEMAAKLRRDEAVVDMLVANKRLCVSLGVDPRNCDTNLPGGRIVGVSRAAEANYIDKDEMMWKCQNCGYIHAGDVPPEKCPVCGKDSSAFERFYAKVTDDLPGPMRRDSLRGNAVNALSGAGYTRRYCQFLSVEGAARRIRATGCGRKASRNDRKSRSEAVG